jgi:hypothetical protein
MTMRHLKDSSLSMCCYRFADPTVFLLEEVEALYGLDFGGICPALS